MADLIIIYIRLQRAFLMMIKITTFILAIIVSYHSVAKPIVIAHRGASGYLPEHTLPALTYAYAAGADYIEQDLVLSKDNHLVVLHDIYLDTVTNVAQVFPSRKRQNGRYYVIDFTLAELKQLTVHERQHIDNTQVFSNRYQGHAAFKISTFAEQIELITQLNRQTGKNVGLYPEIKSPAWHQNQGKDISKMLVKVLRQHNLDSTKAAVYVQCFDFNEIRRLKQELQLKAKLVFLIGENSWNESDTDYNFMRTEKGLKKIAKVTPFIGPRITHLINFKTSQPSQFAKVAKNLGFKIHPYTYRVELLPTGISQDKLFNLLVHQLEINGLFTDFTDHFVDYLKQN